MEYKSQFESFLESTLLQHLVSYTESCGLPNQMQDYITECIKYNLKGGKLYRAHILIDSFLLLNPNGENIEKAFVLGWCVELLQAFFLVVDDIMDQSPLRRNQPCWYKKAGLNAINDSLVFESFIYYLVKLYFKDDACYVNIIELFHEITFKTELGQLTDLLTAPEDKVDLKNFSIKKQHYISTYKTAYYTFCLPVCLALHLNNINDQRLHSKSVEILLKIGQYFQTQDDYLDCYGTESIIGKIGTDIQDNKCSWLICKALEKANQEQIEELHKNYGKKDQIHIKRVKEIYNSLNLAQEYKEYEKRSYNELKKLIEDIDDDKLKRQIFLSVVDKIYKRDK